MTNGEFVSTILNDGRFATKDTYVSKRHILSIGKTYAKTFIAQALDANRLLKQYSLFTPISCFEMEPIDVLSCGFLELKECRNIMQSVCELPELIEGHSVSGIMNITSLDDGAVFYETTRIDFARKKKRKYVRDTSKFYIVEDNRIILLDSETEAIRLEIITLEDSETIEADCGCNSKENCVSLWDEEFKSPQKLLSSIRTQTLQEVLTMNSIPEDENPNMNSNEK